MRRDIICPCSECIHGEHVNPMQYSCSLNGEKRFLLNDDECKDFNPIVIDAEWEVIEDEQSGSEG